MSETLESTVSDRIMASANAMYIQSRTIAEEADFLVELANPSAAGCDHDCDSATRQNIFQDEDTGIDAYAGIEQCGNSRQERMVVVFPDETRQSGIQDLYYSGWQPAMTDSRNAQAMADITAQILRDAYEHARKIRGSATAA